MKLLTQEVLKKLPALYSTEEVPAEEKKIALKFFTPDAQWTWYVIEGERQEDGDYLFFGLVDGQDKELGYFTLNQLMEVRGGLGLPIERDMYFGYDRLLSEFQD